MPAAGHWVAADAAREGNRQVLCVALQSARQRTLDLLNAYEEALGASLHLRYSPQINPPLWETGHVGWFQDYWIARNGQRSLGQRCDPDDPRPPGRLPGADTLYNSSVVAQPTRWQLPLPDLAATRAYLAQGLDETLTLLALTAETPDELYFFRLVLFHEQMHAEAATYMAQALDIALPDTLQSAHALPWESPAVRPRPDEARALRLPGGDWALGYDRLGFAFDNELQAHAVALPEFEIDLDPISWQRYLPFVAAGGYDDPRWWSAAGWHWRQAEALGAPRYLAERDGQWQQRHFGRWRTLPITAPATNLSCFEADAWCRWAGRRLPSEAEWEYAACVGCVVGAAPAAPDNGGFAWGEVWEWTASRFLPYPGFRTHPYRDYSAPWFGERYVLRGASLATAAEMVHPRYRNYFTAERNDIYSGFRSCASSR